MAPSEDRKQISFPYLSYPVHRDTLPKLPIQWLNGRKVHDGAENLWRVHNGLYDLTDFIAHHPGGSYWLKSTKGTDITEAFETHHLKGIAERDLLKYFVRKATTPRNSPFTFESDGFYKTLKSKVVEKLERIPKDVKNKSDYVTDYFLVALIILSPVSCWVVRENFLIGAIFIILNGFVLESLISCGHNYAHRADNWRMHLINFSGCSAAEWRISHTMSHHLFTNTANDLELSLFEPFLLYLPYKDKTILAQMGAFYWPVIYVFTLFMFLVKETLGAVTNVEGKTLSWVHAIPFTLPAWMWLTGGLPFLGTVGVWLVTKMVASFLFTLYGLTAGHHAPTNFFEGDVPRGEHLDWGIHQLDTIVERVEYAGNDFRALTQFGDHALHHFFPTLDHALLKYLYPILIDHCNKFEMELRMTNFYQAVISNSKQIYKKTPLNFREKSTKTQ